MSSSVANLLSISGGKDSTAMVLKALEDEVANLRLVFADTGNEHPDTYEYIRYLDRVVRERGGPAIQWVTADFSERMRNKRAYIEAKWPITLRQERLGQWQESRVLYQVRRSLEQKIAGTRDPAGITHEDREQIDAELAHMGYRGSAPQDPPVDQYTAARVGGYDWIPAVPGMTEAQAQDKIDRALEVLHPTGNPFLDLCLWKGRFPSTKARFCTTELKHVPIEEDVVKPLMEEFDAVVSWQGVRADESRQRAHLQVHDVEIGAWEPEPHGLLVYRPIVDWTADQVFAMHRRHGVEPNPLYLQGMGRVGCMPCIHARKNELYQISTRFPQEIERIAEWERLVSEASKRGSATMMPVDEYDKGARHRREDIHHTTDGIYRAVEWSRTTRGGHQYALTEEHEGEGAPACESVYGLCE